MKLIDFLDKSSFIIIGALIGNEQYLRELSEKNKLPPSTVHKVTKKLLERNILVSKSEKNRTIFSINQKSPLAREITKIIIINNLVFSVSFGKIKKLNPSKVLLFGSAHNGTLTKNSDIDLCIISKQKIPLLDASKLRMSLSQEINREIQLICLTEEEFSSKHENQEIIKNLKNSTTLYG